MAEEFAFGIAAKLLSSLGTSAIQQIGLAWGVKEELVKLEDTVSTIKNVLLDAQGQQMSNNNRNYRLTLQKLQEVLYDADDLMDEVATETQRRERETRDRFVRKVRYFFTRSNPLAFRYKVGSRIKDIAESLDQILSQIHRFEGIVNQVERPIENQVERLIGNTRRQLEETTHIINTREIIGRRDDKDAFVKLLSSLGDQENVVIIPIVGMGGLGKTTLAQLIYNDDKIQRMFPKKLWVCVSTDFNIERILTKILEAGGGGDHGCSKKRFPELQNQVISMLSAHKFLLFLDDVSFDKKVEWSKLANLLTKGASGSRIVVTTQRIDVASFVKTSSVEPYKLGFLPKDDSSRLWKTVAFKKGEENVYENLVKIGEEIVDKCGGVPLALVTLGSRLFLERDEKVWLAVRNNEMWACRQGDDEILKVLRSSYDQMPSHLKQCFAYCSLFKRDDIIDGKKLLYAWMAQGFVQCLDGKGELEYIGESYILELVRRFFLEPCDGGATGRKHYKMHGLVHRLAQVVAVNECLTIEGAITCAIPRMLRHVAFDSETHSEFPKPLMEAKKLRTIFYPRKKNPTFGSSVETVSTSFRCLRVCAFEDTISSPKKIRKLKLLRYLSLHGVDKLPKSLCKLLNLQYLDFSVSGDLNKLPKDLEKLGNLRFLCLSTTLKLLPNKGLGMLTSLRTLIIFDCQALRSLDEWIEHLPHLRELALVSCKKLISLPADLSCLTSLERLEISDCLYLTLSDNDLKGLKALKQLQLRNLPIWLVSLPEGLLDAAGTLTHLEIESCMNFTSPSESVLPKLKLLKSLKIWNCEKVDSLPEGIRGLRLQSVSIVDCPDFTTNYERRAAENQKIAHVPEIEVKNRL